MKPQVLWLMARDPDLRSRWHRWLAANGWTVMDLQGGGEASAELKKVKSGPILVDSSLIKEEDMPTVRELSASHIPVILFGEGITDDKVAKMLMEGADDFVPTSIHERLLTAKLEAHARRIGPELELTVLFSPRRRVKADPKKGLAWRKAGPSRWEPVLGLTDTEQRLLSLFLSRPETLITRDTILDELWGARAAEIYSATLTQHIMSLRKKLEEVGEAIRTVYGRGYMFLEES